MFKHLLVPIDGSDVTKKSLKNVLDLAKKDGASITLVYVSDPMPPMVYSDSSLGYGFSQKDHKKACDAFAKNLFKNALAVLGAGVTVKTLHRQPTLPLLRYQSATQAPHTLSRY